MLKKLLGLAPQVTEDGSYSPSPLSLKLATSAVSNYQKVEYPVKGKGFRILMVCTEEKNMKMKNGKLFSTGNHPVEMLVPMLHFRSAGFDMDICTPTGKEVQIEQWAMPKKDKAVGDIYNGFRQQLKEPLSLQELGVKADSLGEHYAAIFIPGGHGAMLGLPANEDLKILLQAAHKQKLFFLSICHGPAALLAAGINEEKSDFLFKGYEITAFPDAVDRQTPMIGYMPGHLSWQFGAALEERGVKILNKKADKSCHRDRNLITGASPDAADAFGKMATEAMLDSLV